MKLDKELVDNLADLAKLKFEEDGKQEILADLNKILDFVEKLKELNTLEVEPLIHITEGKNILRTDEVKQVISKEEALKNAPEKDKDYIKVPKVIRKP